MDEELLNLILGANNYGSGPGYMEADENPYQRSDQRLNFLSDIMRHTGLYQDDLLGLGPEPEMPDPSTRPQAPQDVFQSDLRAVYQQNPLIKKAFDEIEAGADPISVGADVLRLAENDPEMAKFIPQFQDEFTGQPKPAQQAVSSLLTDFAEERQREIREQHDKGGAYEREMGLYNEQVDAYNDYFVPKSDHELMGSPDLETFVQQSKARAGISDRPELDGRGTGQSPLVRKPNGPGRQPGRGTSGLSAPQLTGRTNVWNEQDSVGQTPDFMAELRSGSNGRPNGWGATVVPGTNNRSSGGDWMSKIGTPLSQGTVTGTMKRQERSSATNKAKWHNDYVNSNLEKFGKQKLDRAKGRMNKSQSEKDNEKRLKAAYSLIFGEAPPR